MATMTSTRLGHGIRWLVVLLIVSAFILSFGVKAHAQGRTPIHLVTPPATPVVPPTDRQLTIDEQGPRITSSFKGVDDSRPTLTSQVRSVILAPVRAATNTVSNAPSVPLPPALYGLKGFGLEGWDFVTGTVGFVANTDATIARGLAGLSTGNVGAAQRAWNDSHAVQQVATTVRGFTTGTRIAAAAVTGNDQALVNAARDSPALPAIVQASIEVPQIVNTIKHGTPEQRTQLLNQANELAGRLTFEVVLSALPGGAATRAPTSGLRGVRTAEDLARTGRPLPKGPRAPKPLTTAADTTVDVSKIPARAVFRTSDEPLTRFDSRGPEVIFNDGFLPRDPKNLSVRGRVVSNEHSAYVGVTRDPTLSLPNNQYRYDVIAPGGIDVNLTMKEMGFRNPFAYEQEVLFPGGIASRYIRGVEIRLADGSYGGYLPNPNFRR